MWANNPICLAKCITNHPSQPPKFVDMTDIKQNLSLIIQEHLALLDQLDSEQLAPLAAYIKSVDRIFVYGAGRTGLALKAAAMRLMHLGYTVHVVGETTTPAIRIGDMLLVASGSGTTASIVGAAEKARKASATVVALTTAVNSPLASLASAVVVIPAAQKQDHGETVSKQYAGSLFEQSVWLLMDAMFHSLWKEAGTAAEELWKRHANLE